MTSALEAAFGMDLSESASPVPLPADLASALAADLTRELPDLIDSVQDSLNVTPDFAAFLRVNREEVLTHAGEAMVRLVESVGRPASLPGHPKHPDNAKDPVLPGEQAELFELIGRLQFREGRDLARLLSAYQIGAHLAWRLVSSIALRLQLPLEAVTALAEALFSFVDALTAASARGYVQEQSESAAERERLRDELAARLLSDRADRASVAVSAEQVGWPVPTRASLILLDPEDRLSMLVLARVGRTVLTTRRDQWLVVIWPDRPELASRQAKISRLGGMRGVVGPSIPLDRLPAGVAVLSSAARLREQGRLRHERSDGEGLVFVEDHLDAVIVHRDPRILLALREQVLAPLTAAPIASRERLAETLASWLRWMGDRRAMAAELHVHPQTVRYRLGQLRELFGGAMDDPATRTRLTIALLSGAGPDFGEESAVTTPPRP